LSLSEWCYVVRFRGHVIVWGLVLYYCFLSYMMHDIHECNEILVLDMICFDSCMIKYEHNIL